MSGTVLFSRLARAGLGDLVQRNIFLHQLRAADPPSRVTWVLGEAVARSSVQSELVHAHSYADDVLFCPDAEDDDRAAMDRFRARLARRGFSRCVVDPGSIRLGPRDAGLVGIGTCFAVPDGGPDGELITHPLRLGSARPDLYDLSAALARALGRPTPSADRVLPRLPMRPEPLPAWAQRAPLVGLHPGGARGWHRRWPLAGFVELAARLVHRHGATVLALGAPDERGDLERLRAEVLDRHPGAAVQLAVGRPLNLLANLIDRMDLLVGNDSAPAHLAAALATPTVVVYGPTSTDLMCARLYPAHRAVSRHYPCQRQGLETGLPADPSDEDEAAGQCALGCPCFHHGPDGPSPRCLTDIPVDEVWDAVTGSIDRPPLVPGSQVSSPGGRGPEGSGDSSGA